MTDPNPLVVPTKERLARAIEETRNGHDAAMFPDLWERLTVLAHEAREGRYDDYCSPYPDPLLILVTKLRRLGEDELAQRAVDGEFDGTAEEARAWAASPEGQAAFDEFGPGLADLFGPASVRREKAAGGDQ